MILVEHLNLNHKLYIMEFVDIFNIAVISVVLLLGIIIGARSEYNMYKWRKQRKKRYNK